MNLWTPQTPQFHSIGRESAFHEWCGCGDGLWWTWGRYTEANANKEASRFGAPIILHIKGGLERVCVCKMLIVFQVQRRVAFIIPLFFCWITTNVTGVCSGFGLFFCNNFLVWIVVVFLVWWCYRSGGFLISFEKSSELTNWLKFLFGKKRFRSIETQQDFNRNSSISFSYNLSPKLISHSFLEIAYVLLLSYFSIFLRSVSRSCVIIILDFPTSEGT